MNRRRISTGSVRLENHSPVSDVDYDNVPIAALTWWGAVAIGLPAAPCEARSVRVKLSMELTLDPRPSERPNGIVLANPASWVRRRPRFPLSENCSKFPLTLARVRSNPRPERCTGPLEGANRPFRTTGAGIKAWLCIGFPSSGDSALPFRGEIGLRLPRIRLGSADRHLDSAEYRLIPLLVEAEPKSWKNIDIVHEPRAAGDV